MYAQMLADEVTASQSSRTHKLGELVITNDGTYGTRVWRFVKNTEASTAFAVGTIVQRKTSTVDDGSGIVCVTAKLPRYKILGVAQAALAAGRWVFVLKEGIGYVLGDGSVAVNDAIMSEGTTGRAKTATLTNADEVAAYFGTALEADGAADSTFRAHIFVP